MNKKSAGLSRRRFITTTAAAIALPTIVPSSIFGQNRPSNRIAEGMIGWGMQEPNNTRNFLAEDNCRVVAACDLNKNHLKDAVDTINDNYQNRDCVERRQGWHGEKN